MSRKRSREMDPNESSTGDQSMAVDMNQPGQNHSAEESRAQAGPKPGRMNMRGKGPYPPKRIMTKLAPTRPYPSVPTSSNATGPRSKRKEGNNQICVTRKVSLAVYLQRCSNAIMKEGHKELFISAMGAAIPQAVMLATSLPGVLPIPRDSITTSISTGTVLVVDELEPQDEDDDADTQSRSKASVEIILRIKHE